MTLLPLEEQLLSTELLMKEMASTLNALEILMALLGVQIRLHSKIVIADQTSSDRWYQSSSGSFAKMNTCYRYSLSIAKEYRCKPTGLGLLIAR